VCDGPSVREDVIPKYNNQEDMDFVRKADRCISPGIHAHAEAIRGLAHNFQEQELSNLAVMLPKECMEFGDKPIG
jgi:hypothetical protein